MSSQNEMELQAGDVNFKVVWLHTLFLILQACVAVALVISNSGTFSLSTTNKIFSTISVTSALLDMFVCYFICVILYDSDIN